MTGKEEAHLNWTETSRSKHRDTEEWDWCEGWIGNRKQTETNFIKKSARGHSVEEPKMNTDNTMVGDITQDEALHVSAG